MVRIISDDFIRELQTGILKEILQAVKKDNRLCLEVRNDCINIYYRGGSLMKISEKKGGKYQFYFNRKYLNPNNTKVNVGGSVITAKDPQSKDNVQTWVDSIPDIKHEMDLYFNKRPKEEREYQQLVLHENNFGGASNDTDYYICDIEYNAKHDGRFDMIAVKWPSKTAARKNANKLKFAFIEMKYMDKALSLKSGLVDHINKMNSFLNKANVIADIKNEMQAIFNLKIELGLLKGIKKIESFAPESYDKPEYILLIVNHDPDKTVFERELKLLLLSTEYASFKLKADLKIAVASYMGYGLYQECILDIEDFMSKNFYNGENKNLKSQQEDNTIYGG